MENSGRNDDHDLAVLLQSDVSDEKLYEMLADSAGLGADEINKVAEGKTLFSRIWLRQKSSICGNKVVQAYIKDPNASDATNIAAQIANLLAGITGINIAIVVCLIIRIGLRTLCAAPADAR